jgi:ribosomal protein S5
MVATTALLDNCTSGHGTSSGKIKRDIHQIAGIDDTRITTISMFE